MGKARELNKILKPLFYRKIITQVIKENNVSIYQLEEKKLVKTNVLKLYIYSDNEEQAIKEIEKNNKFKKL